MRWWLLPFLVGLTWAGRDFGGRGNYRGHKQPDQRQPTQPGQPQVVRVELAVRGADKEHSHHYERDRHRRGGHRSQREHPVEAERRRGKDLSKEKKKKKKKRQTSSSSSSSGSSSSSSTTAKKKKAKKQAKRSSERAQATEDKLMAEIQKLRKTLTPQGEPVTPAKQPATQPLSDFTPKGQSHLKTLLSFMSEGEVTPLVDLAKVRTWQDVEEQLQSRNLPLLKQFLATRIPDRDVPSRKGAAVQKVLQLAKDALPR